MLVLGVVASVSSAPVLAVLIIVLFMSFFFYRRYWRPVVIGLVVMCASVEIVSNRHFYDVLGEFTMNKRTAWYRSMLIDVAIFQGGMKNHWMLGYGYNVDPGWSGQIDLRNHTDVVNHYLLILARFGLFGLVPFLAINIYAIKYLIRAFKKTRAIGDKWMIWCLAAAMVSLAAVFFTVSLFGQPRTIYFMILAFCATMPAIVMTPAGVWNRAAESIRDTRSLNDLPINVFEGGDQHGRFDNYR